MRDGEHHRLVSAADLRCGCRACISPTCQNRGGSDRQCGMKSGNDLRIFTLTSIREIPEHPSPTCTRRLRHQHRALLHAAGTDRRACHARRSRSRPGGIWSVCLHWSRTVPLAACSAMHCLAMTTAGAGSSTDSCPSWGAYVDPGDERHDRRWRVVLDQAEDRRACDARRTGTHCTRTERRIRAVCIGGRLFPSAFAQRG